MTKPVVRKIPKSGGAIMLLVMVFLLLLSLLGKTSMQASILEFKMSGNELFKEEAFQRAQALVDAIADIAENFSADEPIGYTICKPGSVAGNCDSQQFIEVGSLAGPMRPGVELTYKVERLGPRRLDAIPFRALQQLVSSSLAFDAANFEVYAGVDGSISGLAKAELVQGISRLIASAPGASAE